MRSAVSLDGGDCTIPLVREGWVVVDVVDTWCGLLVTRVCCASRAWPVNPLSDATAGSTAGSGTAEACSTIAGAGATGLVTCGGGDADENGVLLPWAPGVDPPDVCGLGNCVVGG